MGRLGAECVEPVVGPASSSTRFMAVGWLDVGETAVAGVLMIMNDDRHDGA